MKKLFLLLFSLPFLLSACAADYTALPVDSQPAPASSMVEERSLLEEDDFNVNSYRESEAAVEESADVPLSNNNTYVNVDGNEVHSPAYAASVPVGASAVCGDGTYSFSQNRRGTCSHHGGVAEWLN